MKGLMLPPSVRSSFGSRSPVIAFIAELRSIASAQYLPRCRTVNTIEQ